ANDANDPFQKMLLTTCRCRMAVTGNETSHVSNDFLRENTLSFGFNFNTERSRISIA
ncbi:hypothetical protein NPIL_377411, partial [Nephila pilipes]